MTMKLFKVAFGLKAKRHWDLKFLETPTKHIANVFTVLYFASFQQ